MHHFFISYHRADLAIAQLLQDRLRENSFEAFIDVTALRSGDQWQEELDSHIRESVALILVLTPESAKSRYVSYEWSFALGAGVKLLPLLFAKTPDMHSRLKSIHRLDFTVEQKMPWRELMKELEMAREAYSPQTIYLPRDTPAVIRQAAVALDSMDAEVRKTAIENLDIMSAHQQAHETLARAVNHPFDDVRAIAAVKLAEKGDMVAFPCLVEALRSGQAPVEGWELNRLGSPVAKRLVDALSDSNARVRQYSARALGVIGYTESASTLVGMLTDTDSGVRAAAATALGQLGDTKAIRPLQVALRDDNEGVSDSAIEALGEIGGSEVIPDLMRKYREIEDWSRYSRDQRSFSVVKALGEIGGADAVQALAECMNSSYDFVPKFAAHALGKIGASSAIPVLVEALQLLRGGAHAYDEALDALVSIGEASVPALMKLCTDPEINVRRSACKTLCQISSEAALEVLSTSLELEDIDLLEQLLSSLRQYPASIVLGPVESLFQQQTNPAVRKILEEFLYKRGHPEIRKQVRQRNREKRIAEPEK